MINLEGVEHHPAIREIVQVLCNQTQNTDTGFFQVTAAYFLGKLASNQRAVVITKDRGEIPVNMYALGLATSGFGKGHSVYIMENEFIKGFKQRFVEETMPIIAEKHLWKIAAERAIRKGTDEQEEFEKAEAEYLRAGAFPFTFDSGTTPAVKQLRHKLIMGDIGAINLQIDEIGSNLINSTDVLTLYLELYDQGIVKQKLTKNTAENQRGEEIDGKTPANMLLFGTPSKLFDGGQTEDHFYSFLDTGYARRCIFGIGQHNKKALYSLSPTEIWNRLVQPKNDSLISKWSTQFHKLAAPTMYGWRMDMDDTVGIQLLTYKIECEKAADQLPDHEEVKKAELSHRYFKALKLAGIYAFIDESNEVEMDHLMQAILLVEESGKAFQTILNREKTYVKLAKYIADIDTEVTHADLHEALPFYKSGNAARNEMMTMAMAWGYKKHIVIKKSFIGGIEFFKGETLKETDLNELILSHSDNWAYDFEPELAPFDQLHLLTQAENHHWANHQFVNKHRAAQNAIPGFNMLVIDVDGGVPLSTAHELMKEYKFMTYTTKRHTEENNRFRMIIPINYIVELDGDEYKEFMQGVIDWLPFKTDEEANQRERKWECCSTGAFHYNHEGEILDALRFIPKTSKNEQYRKDFQQVESLDNLERWFAQRIAHGNRNNQMLKYALALVDTGMNLMEVSNQVHEFNKKLNKPLDASEIDSTIMVTVAKKFESK